MVLRLPQRHVFVDTSAWVALAVRNDQHHAGATGILQTLLQQRSWLYTTNFVVAEAHAFLLRLLGIHAGHTFLQQMDQTRTTLVLRAQAVDEEQAKSIIFQYKDKDFSMTDAISFAVMERMGISTVFTFDRHFSQYGFEALKPS